MIMKLEEIKDKVFIDYHETKKMQYAYVTSFQECNKKPKLSKSLGNKLYANLSVDDGIELVKTKNCSFVGLSIYKEPYIIANMLNELIGRETKDLETLFVNGLENNKPFDSTNKINVRVNYMLGFAKESDIDDSDFSNKLDKETYINSINNIAKDLRNLSNLN